MDINYRQEQYLEFADEIFSHPGEWVVYPRTEKKSLTYLHWEKSKKNSLSIKKDLRSFSQSLKAANIADILAVNLPGCWVMLPNGCNIFRLFSQKIENIFSLNGLQRYDYPMLAPVENFSSVANIIPIRDQILYVGTDSDFINQKPRAGLCPTGEEVIYDHWKSMVRTKEDLPIQMYRQARFYRPMTSSRNSGIFRSMENADVFEFHGCFADEPTAKLKVREYLDMMKMLAREVHVPAIFGIRPLWTNQHRVSFLTLAGDTPLPISGSVQTFCVYMQGKSFSEEIGISYKEKGEPFPTQHVTGAVSRRLMLTHLMLGWNEDGTFFVHPDLCAVQCQIFLIQTTNTTSAVVENIANILRKSGLSIKLRYVENPKELPSLSREAKNIAVPLNIFIKHSNADQNELKIVFERSADDNTAVIQTQNIDDLLKVITGEIECLRQLYDERANAIIKNNVVKCNSIQEAEAVVQQKNGVAIAPMVMSQDSVACFEKLRNGEVLSFMPGNALKKCIITGEMTSNRACISRRI